jgi:OOP family OmpA-OmpF porin
MKKLVRSCLALPLVAAVLPAHADNVAMRPFVSEMLNYTFADNSRQSDNGIGGVIGGSAAFNKFFNVEISGAYSHFNKDNDPPSYGWRDYNANLDGLFFYSRNPVFAPYFVAGGGWARNVIDTYGNRDSSFSANAGLGAIHYFKLFNTDLGLRGDARYRWTFTDDQKFVGRNVSSPIGEPILSVGLVIPLGGGDKVAAAQPVPTELPVKPGKKPVADTSPNQHLDDVHFAFDQYDLSDTAKGTLDSDYSTISTLSSKFPSLKVDLSGHTDWIGTDAYNQALSEKRANVVKEYLIRKGVDAGRIRTYAYGESQPIAPNTTEEGRALNRRTEVRTNASE